MNTDESLSIIKALAEGVDPFTYEPLPSTSPLQNPSYIRAFFTALKGLEVLEAQEKRRLRQPSNTGKQWSLEDDERLLAEFDRGVTIRALAIELGRSINSVRIRLGNLGRLPGEEL